MLLVKYGNHVSLDRFENACIQLVVIKYVGIDTKSVGIATKIILPSWEEYKYHQNAWNPGKTSNLATLLCKYGNPEIQTSLKMPSFDSSSSNMWV